MRRFGWLAVTLVAILALAASLPAQEQKTDETQAAKPEKSKLPEPAREGGYLQRGGADIGRGYAHGGKELGRGTAGFGRNLVHGEFSDAGRSMGRGGAGFGKGVGVGTGRGFKNFGLALRNLGKKVDRSVSDDQGTSKDEKKSD